MKNRCPRCGNTDAELFYEGSKGVYCRACISFSRFLISKVSHEDWTEFPAELNSDVHLSFELTPFQKEVSYQICEKMKTGDVLVWAVTGAGKTELCMDFISQCLRRRKRIAVVIARRQVVLELAQRFSQAFDCHVSAVCEGHTDDLSGDLIVCTAHQCYRFFEKKFDHIIVDEPDAFPYFDNAVLQGIVKNSCTGTMLYLSATPDQQLIQDCQVIKLFQRPHGYDLPVPVIQRTFFFLGFWALRKWCLQKVSQKIPFLVFTPTIKMAQQLTMLLKLEIPVECCTSKTEKKDQVILALKDKKISGLICTTILERGVTFEGIDVCVYHAEHSTFSSASLVQIAGRVGRKASCPTGECLFLAFSPSKTIQKSREMIQYANQNKMSSLFKKTA